MAAWQAVGLVFFVYVIVVATCRMPRRRAHARATLEAICGLVLLAVSTRLAPGSWPNVWLLPPLALLIGYWSSGRLFTAPNARQEEVLVRIDEWAGVRRVAAWMPRPLAELLEAAYVGIYPLIPLGLFFHLQFSPAPDPTRFWSVILVTDFVCFAVLPWVQTRPPRALESSKPWSSSIREFNVRLLGATSIEVNTFPSGHAAEALAVALLTLDTRPWIAAFMLAAAIAVAAGAVLGRYHYLADAIAGWLVAVIVVLCVG